MPAQTSPTSLPYANSLPAEPAAGKTEETSRMNLIAQMQAPQLPPLPEGPSLDRLRESVEISNGYEVWQIVLASVAGALILLLFTYLFLRGKKAKPALPADEAAHLEIIAASRLTDGNDSRFAVLCSQALRRYLEQGLRLTTQTQTSEEFLRSLKGNKHFDSNFQNTLGELLLHFDRIKFGREQLTAEQRTQIADTSKKLIEQTKGGNA